MATAAAVIFVGDNRLRQLMPRARYREIEPAAHAPLLSHPAQVAPAVLDFLSSPAP